MTTETLTNRDQRARGVLETAVRDLLTSPSPKKVSMTARDNHSGEPALYVFVTMPAEKDIPGVAAQNRLVGDMLAALEQIDDERYPYVHFGPREGDARIDDSDEGSERDADSS
jgi:hypothetical protein